MMNDESPEIKMPNLNFLDEKLFKSRSISIFGQINEKVARTVTEQLLALAADSDEPVNIYISSPGGHVESGDVIYDMIKFITPEVRVIGTGWVASAATTLYLAAKKENRFSLPNTRYLVHQPSGGSQGDATDIGIQAEQIIKTKARINRLIADETGRPVEQVEKDTDRDYWMSVDEAIDYGIVTKVIRSVSEI
ncbi:MAG TPA: ATP-dependent Clp protease proteolytic subunit [Pseudomonadales bacterium]|jgi:ATP-dependent Clp protease protease subunit|nr:ATP-dependent Clp protease proteolytic subunit [Pseudomonadales bacterium]MDP6314708.1 ATP-dependent Clp protease proteolytic subunit [Pseudomonadales bacterium]MDP7313271.1 ATP-dependent Clp protease proteolytic subunit [Pseudomonadales bacterium]MDP7577856.1 ATP-dependent Clp protease proteolytic subunit [Pseudomonadales bacterium]HJL61390.1 ATP-dependent Clp protease proteolytic subunit [Pseudomonadales bacterium]|tara:strand:- start:465 stop:1043 length:579 start_codon:yes stop_codon:yes gene_type:complete